MKSFRQLISLAITTAITSCCLPIVYADTVAWDFSAFSGDGAVTATEVQSVEYDGLEIHLNADDTVKDSGILWNSPGSTTSDNKVVSNNRYIKYTPEINGEFSITFMGDSLGTSNNKPRMYIVPGDDESCMSKNNSGTNGVNATASGANASATLTADMVAGRTYYIWPYCYGGSNVKFTVSAISFEEKTLPQVTSVDVVYKNDDTEIARKQIALEGYYEGDKYTYISANYIKDEQGTIYVVGEDYYGVADNKTLNDKDNGGINAVLKQEVTLSADAEIVYNVTETDAIFYDEFENLTGGSASGFDNGRYWASEGKMTTVSTATEVYNVTEDGYYQVLLVGAGTNKGTEVFRSKAEADAQTAYNGGNELLGIKYNNQYYGVYSTYNGYLAEGDVLTVKGFGSGGVSDKIDYTVIRKIDSAQINGVDGISILPGGASAQMEFVSDINENPNWSVSGVDGVTIDENGVVTVSENASEGVAEVKAALKDDLITVTKTIAIEKVQINDVEIAGTVAINVGDTKTYAIGTITDQFGNDITEYAECEFVSSDEAVITIDLVTGVAQAKSKGIAEIGVNIKVGDVASEQKKTVQSDNYYIIANATGDSTSVNISDIVKSSNITGYTVTTADEDGNKISQTTVTTSESGTVEQLFALEDATVIYAEYNKDGSLKSVDTVPVSANDAVAERAGTKMFVWNSINDMKPAEVETREIPADIITVDTKDAAVVEVSPIYTYIYETPDTSEDMLLADRFADGEYSFEITKAPKDPSLCIYDFYINDAMIGNNVNEKGVGREFTNDDVLIYEVSDIKTEGGKITLQKREFYSNSGVLKTDVENRGISKIVVTRTPQISERNTKVYILGDSLVAKYYGEPSSYTTEGLVGTARTGWGQLIDNFFTEDIDVLNLANSGQWAKGLQETAFTCVLQNANAGDYMILESGWNDVAKSTKSEMKQAIIEMTEACVERGVNVILVTPNVSSQTFADGINTQYAEVMREAANEMTAKYDSVMFVDLASLSYDFLGETYGTDTSAMTANINLGTTTKKDNLHLSYLGAMKYAELIAQNMSDQGIDFINKDFQWSCEDKAGNVFDIQVK